MLLPYDWGCLMPVWTSGPMGGSYGICPLAIPCTPLIPYFPFAPPQTSHAPFCSCNTHILISCCLLDPRSKLKGGREGGKGGNCHLALKPDGLAVLRSGPVPHLPSPGALISHMAMYGLEQRQVNLAIRGVSQKLLVVIPLKVKSSWCPSDDAPKLHQSSFHGLCQ